MVNSFKMKDPNGGEWEIFHENLIRFLNGCAYSAAFLKHAKIARTEDDWMQKIGIAPDGATVEFNDSEISKSKEDIRNGFHVKLYQVMGQSGGHAAMMYLAGLRADRQKYDCERNKLFTTVSAINRGNVKWAEKAISMAKGVRDTSVMALGVTASVASGGTLTFFVGGALASGGKVVQVYQDQKGKDKDLGKALAAGGLQAITLGSGTVLGALGAAGNVKTALTLLVGAGADGLEEWYVKDKDILEALGKASVGLGLGALAAGPVGKKLQGMIGRSLYKARGVIGPKGGKLITVNATEMVGKMKVGNAASGDRTAGLIVGAIGKTGEEKGKSLLGTPEQKSMVGNSPQAKSCQPSDISSALRYVASHVMRPA